MLREGVSNERHREAALRNQGGLIELIEDVEQRAQIARHALHQVVQGLRRQFQAALLGAKTQRLAAAGLVNSAAEELAEVARFVVDREF